MEGRERRPRPEVRDFGGEPLVVNIDRAAKNNMNFRTALWTESTFKLL